MVPFYATYHADTLSAAKVLEEALLSTPQPSPVSALQALVAS